MAGGKRRGEEECRHRKGQRGKEGGRLCPLSEEFLWAPMLGSREVHTVLFTSDN